MKLTEQYFMNIIKEKDEEIKRLNEIVAEKAYYEGKYHGLTEKITSRVEVDETFEEVLKEE